LKHPCAPHERSYTTRGTTFKLFPDAALEVRIATDDDPLNGHEPSNIVNRLAKSGGIQIEQSKEAREQWEVLAKAVARVYRAKS